VMSKTAVISPIGVAMVMSQDPAKMLNSFALLCGSIASPQRTSANSHFPGSR
jgi:hypothetical protein